jgi:hypothetical protein
VPPNLTIRLTKKPDRSRVLACTRDDGSVTWQRQKDDFFPHHDLTHYAIETTLGYRSGFFGLLASGWDLGDFGPPWPRGRIPDDADPAELLAGYFDLERATRYEQSAADVNAAMDGYYQQHVGRPSHHAVTDEQLQRIRARMRELFAQWRALPEGESMELVFDFPKAAKNATRT